MKLEPGTNVSHYKILSEIGKGGMGTVYLAQDTKLERKVAIKFLSRKWSRDKDKLKRFQQEAKAASALNHPNILTIYEIDETEGVPYIASEYIEGLAVGSYSHRKKVSLEKALDIAIQIVSALKKAHDSGIVHRDIKPENVMIREDGIVKILDFGLAKLTEKGHDAEQGRRAEDETIITGSPGSPKTMPGMVMGTANYMAPEQARGKEVDQRADIFSFGALMYEMLTRVRPFDGETTSDVIAAVLTKEPVSLRELNEDLPGDLADIVERALSKNKNERFQTSAELLEELERLKRHLQIEEIEKTILPEEDQAETKIFRATTAGKQHQTTTAGADSIVIRKSVAGKVLAVAAAVLIVSAIGYLAWKYIVPPNGQIESLAVMPFVYESGNEEIEYLADGMTENLISSLAKIPNLSVKARSSVFRYKGKQIDPRSVGKELNVQAVLMGRVVQRGNDLTLNLELVDARSENVVWTERFVRKLDNLVALQTEIAGDVANKLSSTLTSTDKQNLAKTYTANSEAQQLYLKGRFHWNKRNTKDFEKAATFFREAIEKDPKYALAYSGLADTYALMPLYSSVRPKDIMPQAKTAALKAIELDDNLAEAHASLGQIVFYFDYDLKRAESEFKRALALNPKYASAHLWYGELLASKEENEKALERFRRALELEPFALVFNRMLGVGLFWNRSYDEAIVQLKKTIELYPNDNTSRFDLGAVYAAKKMYAEAVDSYLIGDRLSGSPEERIEKLKNIFEKDGWEGFQRAHLAMIKEDSKTEFVPNFEIALIYANLEEKENSVKYLEKGYEEREEQILLTLNDANFDFIRDEQRFKDLVEKVRSPRSND
ncbi:MAG: protein kinase [Pyrinomonadaceae bacterium]|nr:protein kinase [Pyrinomonadaceae bacterium]